MKTRKDVSVSEHTPTPWKVIENKLGEEVLIDSKEAIIAEALTNQAGLLGAERNAAFIVRAVNSHKELLFAAKEALMRLQSITGNQSSFVPSGIQARLTKAIAKAEKGIGMQDTEGK